MAKREYQRKKLLRYGPSVLFEWELKEIYKSKCYQRRDDQIIAHAPNLQEGEHCVSLFMVLTKYYGSIFAFSTFKFFSLCSFSSYFFQLSFNFQLYYFT